MAVVLRSGAGLLESEMNGVAHDERGHGGTLFQINHVRIVEPSASDNLQVDDRLFVPVRLIDRTGAVELRMREKVALELSGLADKDEFIAETTAGALNFCMLHSARILVKKKLSNEDYPDEVLSAIIVEAAQQKLEEEFEPNASMIELQNLVNLLPKNVERMIVAPIAAIMHSPHGGMVVSTNGKQHQCSSVLTLIANTGKSHVEPLARGHRIVTKDVWNIPFNDSSDADAGAPEHANENIDGEVASSCTMGNIKYSPLNPTTGKEPVYAMVMISAVDQRKEKLFMIDKVANVEHNSALPDLIRHFKKLSWSFVGNDSSPTKRSRMFSCSAGTTPYSAKKSRRLGMCPTNESLPDPAHSCASQG